MSRPSLLVLVVLVGAAAVAGLVALTRTSAAEAEAPSGSAAQNEIAYRLEQLDKVEADLKQRIADASKPIPTSKAQELQARPTVVLQPALASVPSVERDGDHGDDDDHGEREHDDDQEHGEGDRDD